MLSEPPLVFQGGEALECLVCFPGGLNVVLPSTAVSLATVALPHFPASLLVVAPVNVTSLGNKDLQIPARQDEAALQEGWLTFNPVCLASS